ncbi:MAG: hypothetical protein RL226_2421, partial [Bacteroidota bacterium]
MKTALLFFASLFAMAASAQHYCGFDEFHESLCSDPAHRLKEQEMNHRIHARTLQGMSSLRMNEYTIPVVVHIIHQNGDENISDEQVEMAIEQLNDAFANAGYYITPNGVDVGIRFCLAGTDPNGEFTTGIVRVASPLTNMLVPSQDQALKDVSRWDPLQYLNIWVVNEITREPDQTGVIGFATFPDSHGMTNDGVVCEAAYFGASDENSKVHIHEIGHYLGLYHTFQNGCPNDNCLTSGDRVCDTPPDNVTFAFLCFDGTNSCDTDEDDLSENNPFRPVSLGGIGDQVDEEDNFMDYSSLICFKQFTQGQADRMLAALLEARASLLEGDRCVTPCSEPFTVQVLTSGDTMNAGDEILFISSLPAGVSASWFVNEELAGSGSSFTFSENTQGSYEVMGVFESSDPGCAQELIYNITVICPVDAYFALPSDVLPVGATVDLFGQEGPNTHTWQLNGTTFSTSANAQVMLADPGINSIVHIISNGICTDTHTRNVAVGNCISGAEANLQFWNNTSGEAFGFDFNGNAANNVIAEQPPFTGNSGHNRTTICDGAGNLRYATDGNQVHNGNFEIIPNSNFIYDLSCYMGTLFIEVPGSENLTYLFSNSASEAISNEGLRYSILDNELNNGLGGMTDVKNVMIEPIGSETFVSVTHCNLVDFWLLYYDFDEEVFHAHLVSADGIAPPVVSSVNLSLNGLVESSVLSLSQRGDKFAIRGNVLHFDQATGQVELINNDFFDELVAAYCFSPSGRYLYFVGGDLDITLYRIDTQLPAETWQDNLELIDGLD